MSESRIVAIWWRVLQPGEFYNIERRPGLVAGGGGARYIEIPSSMVPQTLAFFDYKSSRTLTTELTIVAAPIGTPEPSNAYPINIQPKTGNRLRIANQNRQATPNRRHPAWSAAAGFPSAPDSVANTADALQYMPEGGTRIFVAKLSTGAFLAGFTTGRRPSNIPLTSPLAKLYGNSAVGGVLPDLDLPLRDYVD